MDKFCSDNLSSDLGSKALITGVSFPAASPDYQYWSHKVSAFQSCCLDHSPSVRLIYSMAKTQLYMFLCDDLQ